MKQESVHSGTMVIAFYRLENGDYERYEMSHIDFNEAKARFPDLWSLEEPKDGKIHNKVPVSLDVMTQLEANARAAPATPPVVPRQPKPAPVQTKQPPVNQEPAQQPSPGKLLEERAPMPNQERTLPPPNKK